MAKSKVTAIATPEQLAEKWKAHLPEGMTEAQFDKMCSSLRKRFDDVNKAQKDSSHKILGGYWDNGDELRQKLFQNVDKPKQKVVDDLAVLLGVSSSTIRRCVAFAAMYTKEYAMELAKNGLHMGHIEHLLAIEDVDLRKKLEHQIAENNYSTDDTKKLVKDATKDNADALTPAAKARRKQVQSKQKSDAENPVKAVPHAQMKLRELVESISGLTVAVDNAKSMPAEEQLKILPGLKELHTEMEAQRELIPATAKALDGLIKVLEGAKKKK